MLTASLVDTVEGLTAGNIYSFKFRAYNSIGYSDYSDILRVGLGDKIDAPTTVSVDLTKTGPNYITL
jgi:hypothetical protein